MTSTVLYTTRWLLNVTIITCNILWRTIFVVSFPFHGRKAANNSKAVQFREHYQLHVAAILFSFALITHDPPTSAKSSIPNRTFFLLSVGGKQTVFGLSKGIIWLNLCLARIRTKARANRLKYYRNIPKKVPFGIHYFSFIEKIRFRCLRPIVLFVRITVSLKASH